jgi:DNA-binding MarR family transcriptional regulator
MAFPGLNNPLEDRFGYQLRRASVLMMADLAARLTPLGLSIAEASVLVLIKANPGAIQTELGRALAIKRANMAPLIAGLERRGLIRRRAADGRSHALQVNEEGDALATRIEQIMQVHEAYFLGRLPKADLRQLLRRLSTIRNAEEV